MSLVSVMDDQSSSDESCEDLFKSSAELSMVELSPDEDMIGMDCNTEDDERIFGNLKLVNEKDQKCLMTGVGRRDYSLLQVVNVVGRNEEQNEQDDTKPDIFSLNQERLAPGPWNNALIDPCVRETSMWMSPKDLLAAVEIKLSEHGPKLAEHGTLGTGTMLNSSWSKPIVPFVVGALTDQVPTSDVYWTKRDLICSGHKGQNKLIKKATNCILSLKPVYRISAPEIHATSLMAMVISCRLKNASTCLPTTQCTTAHHVEEIVVSMEHVYSDIMEVIKEMSSWPYVERFVNTESFSYTSQVFVRGVYSRQAHTLAGSIHQEITIVYPKTTLPSDGIIISTAMRECFRQATRGLVQITKFSLAIECHGPRPSRYFRYKLDPLHERMGIVCICTRVKVHPSCNCAQRYVETLINPQVSYMRTTHTLASMHVQRLPNSISTIAYNIFSLIDELTRGSDNSVRQDTTMRGNNVTLEVGSFTDKAAFIYYDTKYSFCNQPSLFIEIHISSVLLESARDVVNSVAQMCATVLFMMKYGNPNRMEIYDNKYNDIVKQITNFFPQLTIKTVAPLAVESELPSPSKTLACDACGATRAFVKKAYTSVLVCDEKCSSDRSSRKFCSKLAISNNSGRRKERTRPYHRTHFNGNRTNLTSSDSE